MGQLSLPGSGAIYLDSNAVIYSIERIEPFAGVLDAVWQACDARRIEVVASVLVVVETLVKPLRQHDDLLLQLYRDLLLGSDEVRLIDIDDAIAERAAQLRADAGLKTPDAIHAASALEHNAQLFVTNDPAFASVPGLSVALLSEYAT